MAVVGLAWAAFHTPLIVGAGYVNAGGLLTSIALSLALDLPLAGVLLSLALGIYWTFVAPHLVGLLFRRHAAVLHEVYEG